MTEPYTITIKEDYFVAQHEIGEEPQCHELSALIYHLWYNVEIDKSVKVYSFFDSLFTCAYDWSIVLTEPLLIELFKYINSHTLIDEFEERLDYVEFIFNMAQVEGKLSYYWSLYGKKNNDPGYYGLQFCPVDHLMNLPVTLNSQVKLVNGENEEQSRITTELGLVTPTVIELFKALIFEVTYIGSEQTKQIELQSLKKELRKFNAKKMS